MFFLFSNDATHPPRGVSNLWFLDTPQGNLMDLLNVLMIFFLSPLEHLQFCPCTRQIKGLFFILRVASCPGTSVSVALSCSVVTRGGDFDDGSTVFATCTTCQSVSQGDSGHFPILISSGVCLCVCVCLFLRLCPLLCCIVY